jgi:acyl-CoA hydrolase
MKGIRNVAAVVMAACLAGCLATGCSTLTKYGVTDDLVVVAVKAALEKEGLADTVTEAQMREVIAIVKAEQRLGQIAEEVAANDKVQKLVEDALAKYVKK